MKIFQIVLLIAVSLLFNACGGSGGGDHQSPANTSIEMQPGQQYTVYAGDSLVKHAPDTLVKIWHTSGHSESIVALIDGNATLIRK